MTDANTNCSIDQLVNNLNILKTHPKLQQCVNVFDGKKWIVTPDEDDHHNADIINLINTIEYGLNEHLITNEGQHNYINRRRLFGKGFRFEKGESDSFGPLTSVIVIDDYRLCYG